MTVLLGINILFRVLYAIVLYAACAYSLYIIAKRNAVKYPFLAFVPIVQNYVIGSVCEEYELLGYRIKRLDIVLCVLALVQSLGLIAGMPGMLFNLAANILMALVLHKFFYLFVPQHAFIFAILSLFGRLPLAIILFIIKEKPMQMSAAAYPYPFPNKIR